MRRKVILLLAAMAAAVLVAMGTALAQTAPQGTLDANNLDASPSTSFQFGLASHSALAQTFTAERSGELTSAQALLFLFAIGDPPTQPFTMEIHNVDASGAPVGDALASTTIPASEVSQVGLPGSLVTGVFEDPASIVAGQQYALVLKTNSTLNYAVAVSSDLTGSSYDGGMLLFQSDPFGQFGTPGSWIGYSVFDMIFAIYVTPEVTTPEVTFDSLCEQVKEFVSSKGIADSMCAKLAAAEKAAERGKTDTAENALKAFKNAVNAQENKKLTSDEADDLLEGADQLIATLRNNDT